MPTLTFTAAEVDAAVLQALREAPTCVPAELTPECFPAAVRAVEASIQRLQRQGRVCWRYRRWHPA